VVSGPLSGKLPLLANQNLQIQVGSVLVFDGKKSQPKQRASLLLRPSRGEMFIERATAKRISSLHRSETYVGFSKGVKIALRWSSSYRVQNLFYKHLAPLERTQIIFSELSPCSTVVGKLKPPMTTDH
jgi:hypothetical protein